MNKALSIAAIGSCLVTPNTGGAEILQANILTTNNGLSGVPDSMNSALNDMGDTLGIGGEIVYNINGTVLHIHALLNGYVTSDGPDSSRVDPNNKRIDMLSFSIDTPIFESKDCTVNMGVGVQVLGNFGGYNIQNSVHKAIEDSYIPATYDNTSYIGTPTITGEVDCSVSHNSYFDTSFGYTGVYPLLKNNGIQSEEVEVSIKGTLGDYSLVLLAGIDSENYPNISVFDGYPLIDTQGANLYLGAELGIKVGEEGRFYFKAKDYNSDDRITDFEMGYTYDF